MVPNSRRGFVAHSMLSLIGNTPLLELSRVTKNLGMSVMAKLEYLNPSGSIKDRMALKMIEEAEKDGSLKPGYTIIEASSGNTAIALAFVGAMKGYKVDLYMPRTMQAEKISMIKRYGAGINLVDVEKDLANHAVHGAYIEIPGRIICREREQEEPKTWWARQFSNPNNTRANQSTGKEILKQTDGRVDAFIASVGTGGTLLGVAEALKAKLPHVRIFAVEPLETQLMTLSNFTVMPGITGGILTDIRQSGFVEEIIKVKDEDAVGMARRLSAEEGLFCGMSSGANVFAAITLAKKLGPGQNVVTILPDRGDRYFSSAHYIT